MNLYCRLLLLELYAMMLHKLAAIHLVLKFGKFIDDNDYNIHIILIFHMSPNGLVSELISELI